MTRLASRTAPSSPFYQLKSDTQERLRLFRQLEILTGGRRTQAHAFTGIAQDDDLGTFAADTYVIPSGMFSARDRATIG